MNRSTILLVIPCRQQRPKLLTRSTLLLNISYSQVIHMHPTRLPASGGQLSFLLRAQQAKTPRNPLNNFPIKKELPAANRNRAACRSSRLYSLIVGSAPASLRRKHPLCGRWKNAANRETNQATHKHPPREGDNRPPLRQPSPEGPILRFHAAGKR